MGKWQSATRLINMRALWYITQYRLPCRYECYPRSGDPAAPAAFPQNHGFFGVPTSGFFTDKRTFSRADFAAQSTDSPRSNASAAFRRVHSLSNECERASG
jgi:hypothetical protein